MAREDIFTLSERSPSPVADPPSSQQFLSSVEHRDKTPIVIDNGGSELRAGFASQVQSTSSSSSSSAPRAGDVWSTRVNPSPPLHFPPIVSKYRDRKKTANVLLVGPYANMDTESKSKARNANENGLLVAQDVMENVLDFTFSKLGIVQDAGAVEHPIVITEPLCNPGYCRGLTSELLFEAYGAPEVSYGIDSLFAAYANDVQGDAIIVNGGQTHTTIIPMLNGRGLLGNAKRLNWGGNSASDFLLRSLQLKYPGFPVRLTSTQTHSLIQRPGLFYTHPAGQQGDYAEHLTTLSHLDRLQAEGQKVQIPFVVPESTRKQLSEEEKQQRLERKKESARRLQEMTQRNRLQKLMEKEEQLKLITELKDAKAKERKAEWLQRLESAGFDSEQDLDKQEKKLQSALKRSRRRDVMDDDEAAKEDQEVPSFPLIDVPDHELTEETLKEKRKQRLFKAGYDARMRAKAEKAEERRLEEERRLKDEQERTNDPLAWTKHRRIEYEQVIERIKERKRRRELLSDRKSLAAQQRMKNITSLASDSPSASRNKRKRGGGNGPAADKDDDDFGADDADWAVYRDIQGAEDSEDEEEDEQQLVTLESKLLMYDATFSRSDTLAARQARKRALTRTFLGGTPEGEEELAREHKRLDGEKNSNNDEDEDEEDEASRIEELARNHQICLNVERSRLAEVFFQPSLAGVDQAGLDEIIDMIVRGFPQDTRRNMVNNVFLTGRHTSYAQFDARLKNSLIATQPIDYSVNVRRAHDVRFDAWKGMARWCLERPQERKAASITRAEYDEFGSDYIKDHPFVSAMV